MVVGPCSIILTKDKKYLHESFSNDASYLYQTRCLQKRHTSLKHMRDASPTPYHANALICPIRMAIGAFVRTKVPPS